MAEQLDLDTAFGRLRWAREQAGYKKASDFAAVVRIPPVTYRAYENGQNGYFKHALDFAQKLGVPADWLMRGGPLPEIKPDPIVKTEVRGTGMSPSQVRDALAAKNAAKLQLLGTAMGGDFDGVEDIEMHELRMSEILDYLPRPPTVADDPEAYAVEIMGDSMAPRFKPGERVPVSPKVPVRIGDDVVVQLNNGQEDEGSDVAGEVTMVLIKELVKRTSEYVDLLQHNPQKIFRVPMKRVRHMHRVKGRL